MQHILSGGSANDSAALQAALDAMQPLDILSLSGTFILTTPVSCLGRPVIIDATGATFNYTGPNGQTALTFGFAPGDIHTYTDGLTLRGIRLVGPSTITGTSVGLCIQNSYCPLIDDLAIRGFGVGLRLIGDGVGCTHGRVTLRRFKDNATQIHAVAKNGGFVTEWNFIGSGNFSYNSPWKGQPCYHLRTESQGTMQSAVGSLRFIGVSFEAQDDNCVVADVQSHGGNIHWISCRYETITHKPMPLRLGPNTYRCRLVGCTTADVLWQDSSGKQNDNEFLPWWK